jgi:hypothetical protein
MQFYIRPLEVDRVTMSRNWLFVIGSLIVISNLFGADKLNEKYQKKLETVETTFYAAVQKADNAKFFAVQKANADRVKALKQMLAEVTKAGDFDTATKVKELVAIAESVGKLRTKPKNVLHFNGHEYFIATDKATWHQAEQYCQEMGGHLVTFESPQEQAFVLDLCLHQEESLWIGLSNEKELKWHWVNGIPAKLDMNFITDDPHRDSIAAGMLYSHMYYKKFTDWYQGAYSGFICEWD